MKATGVVRRIDDLGRIVIPKEIRRSLKISEGDSVEIFVDSSSIILKKYSLFDNMIKLANNLVESFGKLYNKEIMITDKEKIIAASKELRVLYLGKEITDEVKDLIENRNDYLNNNIINNIANGIDVDNFFLVPIIANSDCLGSIILINKEITDEDMKILHVMNSILIKNVEE